MNIVDCKIHMHIGSPAGQLLNLSVHQTKEQLWPCICRTSGELSGSNKCKAQFKKHSPLQTTTKTSLFLLFPRGKSSGLGKCASFSAQGNGAGDAELLCKYGMWHWNEELWEKCTEEWVSWGKDSSGGSDVMAVSEWPWQSCVFYGSTHHSSSHTSKPAPTETPAAVRGWVSKILKEYNNETERSFTSIQHPSVLQAKSLATAQTLH